MLAVALAIGSSLCWGSSDFLGGIQSRRLSVPVVLIASQVVGLAGALVLVVASGHTAPGAGALAAAGIAGFAGTAALGAFYHALSIGTMSIVAPISATGAAVPVIVGLAGGDRPSGAQVAGIAAAFAGVVLASRELHEDAERAAAGRLSVILALVAAAGFGAYFVGIDRAANESVFWALAASRACATAMLAGIALVVRPALGAAAAALPVLVLIGTLDLSATILYAFASTKGLLSVVGVLGSLYPVVTILLARALLGERIRRIQEVGVVTALAGVALIAAG